MLEAFKGQTKEIVGRKTWRVTFKGSAQNSSDAMSARDPVGAIKTLFLVFSPGADPNKHRILPAATRTHLAVGSPWARAGKLPQLTTPSRRATENGTRAQVPALATLSRAGSVSSGRSLIAEAN